MGYSSYAEYLNSDLWRSIRRRAFASKGTDCFLCKGKASEIHHTMYHRQVLEGKTLFPLIPLCRKCHVEVEFNEDGAKLRLRDAFTKFNKIRRKVYPIQPKDRRTKNQRRKANRNRRA